MYRLAVLLLLTRAVTLAGHACAAPLPSLNVRELVSNSDVVLKGEVIADEFVACEYYPLPTGKLDWLESHIATFRVDRTLAGTVDSGELVPVHWSCRALDLYTALVPGDYGLLFARREDSGLAVSHRVYPLVPVSRNAVPDTHASDPLGRVEEEMLNSLHDSDSLLVCLAAKTLGDMLARDALAPLRDVAANHPNPLCRAWAFSSLLSRLHDSSAIRPAMELVQTALASESQLPELAEQIYAPASPAYAHVRHAGAARSYLLGSLAGEIHTEDHLQAALTLARMTDHTAQRAGLQALRQIGFEAGSFDTITRALELLDDPELGWSASMTLAEITDHRHTEWCGGSREDFDANRDHYVNQWRQWWESEGKTLYPPPGP